MSENKFSNRIPFEEIQSASVWSLPSLDNGAKVVPSVKKKKSDPNTKDPERIEDVEPAEIKPLTAAQLQQITEQAEAEGHQQGYQAGLQEGTAQGRKAGEQKAYLETKAALEQKMKTFTHLTEALLDPVAMQQDALENWIVDTAMQLAKHLIFRELTEDPSALFHVVERAVSSLPAGAKNIRVYLHADDVELAHEAFADSGQQWQFYPDPQLARGGCRVVSEQSLVDYTVENRLQKMLDQINFQGEVDDWQEEEIKSYRPLELDSGGDSSLDLAEQEDRTESAAADDLTAENPQHHTKPLLDSDSDIESEYDQ